MAARRDVPRSTPRAAARWLRRHSHGAESLGTGNRLSATAARPPDTSARPTHGLRARRARQRAGPDRAGPHAADRWAPLPGLAREPHARAGALAAALGGFRRRARRLVRVLPATRRSEARPPRAAHAAEADRLQR